MAVAGCRPGKASRESITAEEFTRRAKEIRGVTTVSTAGDEWTLGFSSSLTANGLKAVSDGVFRLVNSVDLAGRPAITLRSGTVSADVGRTDVSGRPPQAPELRWVRRIDGTSPHRGLVIEEHLARVSVDIDPMAWLRPVVARRTAVEKYSGLRVSHEPVHVLISPGEPGAAASFAALDRVSRTAPPCSCRTVWARHRGWNCGSGPGSTR
ncbi:MAG: hypothetical protein WAV52_07750 [Luteococcus japonicus]